MVIPYVIEPSAQGERSYDIYSRLLKDRIIFIGSGIDDQVANAVVAQLLFLNTVDPKKDIHIYINSPGGSVSAGLAIMDTMKHMSCNVKTYCIGIAASMGAVLLCSGTKGHRYVLPHAKVMIHQPLIGGGGLSGQATDIMIHAKNLDDTKKELYNIMAEASGQPYDKIERDCDRDYYLSAVAAKEYGLVDHILTPTPK